VFQTIVVAFAAGMLVKMVNLNQWCADMKTYRVWSSETVQYMVEVKAKTEEEAKNQILSEVGHGKSYCTANFEVGTVEEVKGS
jgi:hypothetical protein